MKGIFNIVSRPNTICTGVACNMVWYVLRTEKSVAARITYQVSYLSRYLFYKSNVCTGFPMT